MRRTTLFFILLIQVITMAGQKTVQQEGMTYKYNGKKARSPLGNVYLKFGTTANDVLSDSVTGEFTVLFRDLKMGDRVGSVTAYKNGMAIFNQAAVEEWNIRKEPLRLIMCNKKELERQKQALIAIGRKEAYKKYEQRLSAIEAKYKEGNIVYHQKLAEAEEELNRFHSHLEDYADYFVRIDESEIDTATQRAMELFRKGDVNQAIELFNQGRYLEKLGQTVNKVASGKKLLEKIKKEVEAGETNIVKYVNNLKSEIAAYKLANQWEKAGQLLKNIADMLKIAEHYHEYAVFCLQQNEYKDAEAYLQKALEAEEALKRKKSLYHIAIIKNHFGQLYFKTNRMRESERMYTEAQNIFLSPKTNEEQYLPEIAMVRNNLGILYHKTGQMEIGVEEYKKALEIRRRLAAAHPDSYNLMLAATLNNMASVYRDELDMEKSINMYEEALTIYRQQPMTDQQECSHQIADLLINIASLKKELFRTDESEKNYIEALQIYRSLAKDNPQAYKPGLATTLNHLASSYTDIQKLDEGLKLYQEAIGIWQELSKRFPQTYLPDLATSLNGLAIVYHELRQEEKSYATFNEALVVYKNLWPNTQKIYEPLMAMTQCNIANFYASSERHTNSFSLYKEAKSIFNHNNSYKSRWFRLFYYKTLNNEANFLLNSHKLNESDSLYKECLEHLYGPDILIKSFKAVLFNNIGVLYADSSYQENGIHANHGTLIHHYLKREVAIPIFMDASRFSKRSILADFSALFETKKSNNDIVQMSVQSEKYFKDAIALFRELSTVNRDMFEHYQNIAVINLALLYMNTKQYAACEKLLGEIENNYFPVATSQCQIISYLATALLFQGKFVEAEKIYRQHKDELKERFLDDFKQFGEAGVIPDEREKDVERIKQLLN